MGKILSVWSGNQKTGRSVFLYSMVNHLDTGRFKRLKILVCCANLKQGKLLKLFNIPDEELNMEDAVNIKITSGGEINIFSAAAKRNNIYFMGSKKANNSYARQHLDVYEELLKDLKEEFDLVIIDTMSGRENTLTNMILEKSDIIINMICQDKESLDSINLKNDKDLCYIVNKYRSIYPDAKNLSTLYELEQPVFTLPLCDDLQEMKNKGKLDLYQQHETEYNRNIERILDCISEGVGIRVEENDPKAAGDKGFLNRMLRIFAFR